MTSRNWSCCHGRRSVEPWWGTPGTPGSWEASFWIQSPGWPWAQYIRTLARRRPWRVRQPRTYAPRLPADPLARSECIRSFVCSLRALQAPCLGTTLGGTPPPEPHPQGPPGTPPTPPPHPTPHPPHHPMSHPQAEWKAPPHPPPIPLVRVEGYSKWMAIPSGWLFRVHGYSEGSYFNSKFESNKQGRAQTQSMQKALTASVGHCTFCPVTTRRRL